MEEFSFPYSDASDGLSYRNSTKRYVSAHRKGVTGTTALLFTLIAEFSSFAV
jgi:hypothetical protein